MKFDFYQNCLSSKGKKRAIPILIALLSLYSSLFAHPPYDYEVIEPVFDAQYGVFTSLLPYSCDDYCYDTFYNPPNCYTVVEPALHTEFGRGQSWRTGYQTAELTLGLYDTLYNDFRYLDFRFHYIDHNLLRGDSAHYAGNIGVGFREYSPLFDEVYGAYIYYDFQCLPHIQLQQIGFGGEFLGHALDLRANAYIPIGRKNVLQSSQLIDYGSGFLASERIYKTALWRFEVEVGRWIVCRGPFNIYGAAGPYFFGGKGDCCGTNLGGMGRLSSSITNWLDIDLYATIDPVYQTCYQIEISLTFPFPRCLKCCKEQFERVRRNDIILLKKTCSYDTNF